MSRRPADLNKLLSLLPQKQCGLCGYGDCAGYAAALINGESANLCRMGGKITLLALSSALGKSAVPNTEGYISDRTARIEPMACIGCTRCIRACPMDAIAGAPKRLHGVLSDWCTGCGKCEAACPVDCISFEPAAPWNNQKALTAKEHYEQKCARTAEKNATRARQLENNALMKKKLLADILKNLDPH